MGSRPIDLIVEGGVPPDLRGILLDFPWELSRLLALKLPIEEIKLEDLRWQLDLPWWREDEGWFVVTPNQIRRNPADHDQQWERTHLADLSFPIHVTDRGGRPVVLDGVHRLLKAEVQGWETILARWVPEGLLPLIALQA